MRANRLAPVLCPADADEHRLGFRVDHPHHLGEAQGAGGGGEEEMLAFGFAGHGINPYRTLFNIITLPIN
jgi:hypothetical protein